jgi:aspartyl-tRNA(Asn)/glutamyl-tRNA(Gln) amidotransferase subunit C
MGLDPEEVRHVASLARLGVTEEELPQLAHDLSRILDHVSRLSEVPAEQEAQAPPSAGRRPDLLRSETRERLGEISAAELISRSSGAQRTSDGAQVVAVPTVVKKDSP